MSADNAIMLSEDFHPWHSWLEKCPILWSLFSSMWVLKMYACSPVTSDGCRYMILPFLVDWFLSSHYQGADHLGHIYPLMGIHGAQSQVKKALWYKSSSHNSSADAKLIENTSHSVTSKCSRLYHALRVVSVDAKLCHIVTGGQIKQSLWWHKVSGCSVLCMKPPQILPSGCSFKTMHTPERVTSAFRSPESMESWRCRKILAGQRWFSALRKSA